MAERKTRPIVFCQRRFQRQFSVSCQFPFCVKCQCAIVILATPVRATGVAASRKFCRVTTSPSVESPLINKLGSQSKNVVSCMQHRWLHGPNHLAWPIEFKMKLACRWSLSWTSRQYSKKWNQVLSVQDNHGRLWTIYGFNGNLLRDHAAPGIEKKPKSTWKGGTVTSGELIVYSGKSWSRLKIVRPAKLLLNSQKAIQRSVQHSNRGPSSLTVKTSPIHDNFRSGNSNFP